MIKIAKQIVCTKCGSKVFNRIYEYIVEPLGASKRSNPIGKFIALECSYCSKRVKLQDLLNTKRSSGEVFLKAYNLEEV